MTLYRFLKAVAGKLTDIWPQREVWVNRLPGESDGHLYINIKESSEKKELGRRRRRKYKFEVLLLMREDDNLSFCDWAEAMYEHFEHLDVEDGERALRRVRLSAPKAERRGGGVYAFSFGTDFRFLLAQEDEDSEIMQELISI